MAHYAKVTSGTVVKVIVAESSFFDNFVDDSPGNWIETFKDRSSRKNFASVGWTYDNTRDAFIPPKPHSSWTLNEDTCIWESPVAYPDENENYKWNDATQSWDIDE